MDHNATVEEGECRNDLEMIRPISDKHLDLLRPSARNNSAFKGHKADDTDMEKGKYSLMGDEVGTYDKPLPCFGCGIGWFSFLLGFLFPVMWYYASILYFGNYYRRDPRASAIAAMVFSAILLIIVIILLF